VTSWYVRPPPRRSSDFSPSICQCSQPAGHDFPSVSNTSRTRLRRESDQRVYHRWEKWCVPFEPCINRNLIRTLKSVHPRSGRRDRSTTKPRPQRSKTPSAASHIAPCVPRTRNTNVRPFDQSPIHKVVARGRSRRSVTHARCAHRVLCGGCREERRIDPLDTPSQSGLWEVRDDCGTAFADWDERDGG
jgi:hypothetical protein